MQFLPLIAALISVVASLFVGLVSFGLRKQVEVVDQKIETVRQEFHAQLAEAGNKFFMRVNGNYVKKDFCNERCGRD